MQKLQRTFLLAFCLAVLLGCTPPPRDGRPGGNAEQPRNEADVVNEPETAVQASDDTVEQIDVVNEPETETVNEADVASESAEIVQISGPITPQTSAFTNNCHADLFLEVTAHPNNGAYPDPELSVTCDDQFMVVDTNNIPSFEFVRTTPNELEAQDFTFNIPLNPTPSSNPDDVPLGGITAVMVDGVVIFGPTEAGRHNYRDPYLDGILDYCNGHTARAGMYHYHAATSCIFAEYEGNVGLVVAYSFDGYPILAPYLCEDESCTTTQELRSSWQLTNENEENAWLQHSYVAGSGDLDECNGMLFDDGSYAYFATETFPYFMGCYYGEVEQSNFPSNRGGNGGGG